MAGVLWTTSLLITAAPAAAHPLGNFTVNTHVGIRVEPAAVALAVVVDIAEVPTLRAFPMLGAGSGGAAGADAVPEADQHAYRERMCPALRDAVRVELDGNHVELAVVDSSLRFLPGDAGLATARLECRVVSARQLATAGRLVTFTDSMAVTPVGWREVTAVGDGVRLASSTVPERSVTGVLREYPPDRLDTPLDQREATVRVVAGSGVVTGPTAAAGGSGPGGAETRGAEAGGTATLRGLDPMTTAFTDLVSAEQLGVGFGIFAAALAVLLGALHALAPGHGKTLMAAYLVGRDGSLRQAALIGVSVTLTHTAGVLILGTLLSAVSVAAPERVYPWLSLVSGLLLVAIGLALLRSAWERRASHVHAHAAGHAHAHGHAHVHGHAHAHGHDPGHVHGHAQAHQHGSGGSRPGPSPGGNRGLLAVGFAGGLVPSPSALVVLLGGIALGRAWFGVLLVLAYGVGMALGLIGVGAAVAHARGRLERWSAARGSAGRRTSGVLALTRALPVVTSGLVVVIGIGVAGGAVTRL